MANAYAALGEFCAAPTPIRTWIALDPATRDNSQTQKIIDEYEERGHCAASKQSKERHLINSGLIKVKAEH